jgi:hypothetical protein
MKIYYLKQKKTLKQKYTKKNIQQNLENEKFKAKK